MSVNEIDLPGVAETVARISQGKLTAERALEARLEVIAAREPDLEAWVTVDADSARAAARRLDAGPTRGPLHGVPLGVKDIFATQGLPMRCGSPIHAERVASFDAGSVALARAAGAVILGKTETTEFATYKPTRTRNPYDPSRTPGGSSSGSAAGVACGMMPLAFGSQTAGSIVRPASYCGVVGFKPTIGLIESGGVSPLSRSFDTVGFFTNSVEDAAYATAAVTGLDLTPDGATAPRTLPVYRSPMWGEAEADLVTAWEGFERELGPRYFEQRFDPDLETALADATELHVRILAVEASEALAFEHQTHREKLSPGLREMLDEGRAMDAETRADDRAALRHLRHMFDALVPRDAVFLTPSAPGPAPAFKSGTGSPVFNRVWTLLGVPCISLPLLKSRDGLPMGVQVVGAVGNDRGVLSVAQSLMQEFASR